MEEVAGLGNLVKAVHVLDPHHDLMDDQQRGDPTNAAAIYIMSARVRSRGQHVAYLGKED
jgi:hypothetical protein